MRVLKYCAILTVICSAQVNMAIATEYKSSTYQRQTELMKQINEGQKSKELTVKQAKDLRKDLSRVAVRKQKVRDAKPGKDQSDNISDIDQRLTETSQKLDKFKRENLEKSK